MKIKLKIKPCVMPISSKKKKKKKKKKKSIFVDATEDAYTVCDARTKKKKIKTENATEDALSERDAHFASVS